MCAYMYVYIHNCSLWASGGTKNRWLSMIVGISTQTWGPSTPYRKLPSTLSGLTASSLDTALDLETQHQCQMVSQTLAHPPDYLLIFPKCVACHFSWLLSVAPKVLEQAALGQKAKFSS